jgi:hypothetical protein
MPREPAVAAGEPPGAHAAVGRSPRLTGGWNDGLGGERLGGALLGDRRETLANLFRVCAEVVQPRQRRK